MTSESATSTIHMQLLINQELLQSSSVKFASFGWADGQEINPWKFFESSKSVVSKLEFQPLSIGRNFQEINLCS